jgi:heterodisulfide reductase subunit A
MAKNVCVIGAGVTGLSLANNLTQSDTKVVLIDRNPYPGGRTVFYGCKATDSCVHCGVCLARDAMAQLQENSHLEMLLSSIPRSIRRNSGGSFEIDVETLPNQIDWKKCIECGLCQEACPENAVKRIEGWKFYIENTCNDCGKCVEVCPVSAIHLERNPKSETLVADSLIVSTGFTPFEPGINRKWGYGDNPRVITGSDLERLFYEEKYLPDEIHKDESHKIAFIQCVGSRNIMEGMAQCSRICCAFALRMAGRIKHEKPESEIDFYYMDIQRFGKNFESFWATVSDKINFIRSNPLNIKVNAEGKPIVRFEAIPDNKCEEAAYDLVVLSHGLCPSEDTDELAEMFELDFDSNGFFKAPLYQRSISPLKGADGGQRDRGLFIAGTCKGPMNIEECIDDASAVSEQLLEFLGEKI